MHNVSQGLFFFLMYINTVDAGKVLSKAGFGGIQLFQTLASLLHSLMNISGISNYCGNTSLELFSKRKIGRGWFYKVHKMNGALLP